MELWVRSQLKGCLIKVNDLRITQLDKDGFTAIIEKEARDEWCILANDDPCIGSYKTKERALEVLDEIQRLLNPMLVFRNCNCDEEMLENITEAGACFVAENARIEQINTCIYEMPEE